MNRLQKSDVTAWAAFEINLLTNKERWKHFSTKTSSSSDSGIWRAISEGLTMARALTTLNVSFLSNLSKSRDTSISNVWGVGVKEQGAVTGRKG